MKLTLNLASRRYVNQRALKHTYLGLLLLLVALLAWQLTGILQQQQEVTQIQGQLQNLQLQLQEVPVERLSPEQLKSQQQQYQWAQALLQRDAFRWTALFDRLEHLLPNGASIRSLNPDYQKDTLVLVGVVKELTDLQTLLDRLHADSFTQVFLQNQSQILVSDGAGGKKSALSYSIKLEGVF